MRRIYLDNASTTPVKPEVMQAMQPCFTQTFGNASSIHFAGRQASAQVEKARGQVAAAIGAKKEEIYFTSGGTEADNWAIKGTARALAHKGKHIITSSVEHHAVLHSCQWLEKEGFEVSYLPVDSYGMINPEEVRRAIRPDTILITIMLANNEVGTIEPIEEITKIARQHNIRTHTDAVQAVGAIPVDVDVLGVDMLSLSAHKLYGPKGVGALYVRKGIRPEVFMHGGAQERGQRASTENLAGIVGLGAAVQLSTQNLEEHIQRTTALRNQMIQGILHNVPHVKLNGHPEKRLPGNVNISVRYIEGEALLLRLDLAGIMGSSGSACTSGSLDPSHVLLAMGLSHEVAHGSLRLTIGDFNTEEEVAYVLEKLPKIAQALRDLSPIYYDMMNQEKQNV